MARRLLSIWFPRLASDISLRVRPVEGPFALTLQASNAEHLHCLNSIASATGLHPGMPLADARAAQSVQGVLDALSNLARALHRV